jgi:hypothetical protein
LQGAQNAEIRIIEIIALGAADQTLHASAACTKAAQP